MMLGPVSLSVLCIEGTNRFYPLSFGFQFGLVDRRLALNTSCLGPRLSFSLRCSCALHGRAETQTRREENRLKVICERNMSCKTVKQ